MAGMNMKNEGREEKIFAGLRGWVEYDLDLLYFKGRLF